MGAQSCSLSNFFVFCCCYSFNFISFLKNKKMRFNVSKFTHTKFCKTNNKIDKKTLFSANMSVFVPPMLEKSKWVKTLD